MTAVRCWLADLASELLEPDERDAVRGDHAELGVTAGCALREVLGLVVRRQASMWMDWRPWLALVAVVVPIGMVLSHASRWWADASAIYLFLYVNNWTWAFLEIPGARLDLLEHSARFLLHCLALIGWSWTSGYVLGSLSRRTLWITGSLFCLVVVLATVGSNTAGRGYNSPIFSLTFYGAVFPRLLRLVTVLAPAAWGMRSGLRRRVLPLFPTMLGGVAIMVLTALTGESLENALIARRGLIPVDAPLLPLLMVWPVAYMLASASWRRWRGKAISGALISVLTVAFALSASGVAVRAQHAPLDYPQWRGQQRDGAASGFVEPRSWPQTLTRRWRVDIGEGYSTPLVIGDTVYVFTRRDGNEIMMALDARTGAEQWRSSYPAPFVPSQPAAAHGAGPKATPLFHEGRLFTQGIGGIVSAFDAATGTRLWQTPPPAEPPFFSAASSPLGEPGLVIVHPGNYGPLTAFDSNTGKVRWTAGGGGFFASPIAVDLGGIRQVISATQDSVIGVSLDGRVLWRHPWQGGGGSTTPVLNDGMIIVSAMGIVAAVRPTFRDGTWAAETVWDTKDVSMYVSNPVVVADTLYGLSQRASGQFFALDARTGKTLWLGQPREATNTAVAKAGNLLFLLNDDAELIVARASRSGFEPVVRYTLADSATWAQPTISGNRIFVKDVTSLSLWIVD